MGETKISRKLKSLLIIIACLQFIFADLSSLDSSAVINGSARPMGMGGMFTTVKGDPSSIINNPAGLADDKIAKYFIFSGKTLQEVNYLVGGISMPVENLGTFGLAIINRSVDGIPITQELTAAQISGADSIDLSNVNYSNYTEDTLFLSYANKFYAFDRDIAWGLSTKFFQRKLVDYKNAEASGMNLDVGSQFAINRDIDMALKIQNLISGSYESASAGSLLWGTGESEPIDAHFVIGISNKTLYHNVLLGLDLKKNMSRSDYPWAPHLGLEWHPLDQLFLRCGLDQSFKAPDASDGGALEAVNNYSVGVGINLYGYRFDYAYRPNSEIKDLSSHMFSISFVGPEPVENVIGVEEELVTLSPLMELTYPNDRTVTQAVTVEVRGRIFRGNKYILNDEEYELKKGNQFEREMVLALGINDITLTIPGAKQKLIHKVLRLAYFDDIGQSPYKNSIVNMATLGYIRGDYPQKFNPDRYVSRAELAALVIKINRFMVPLSMKGIWDDVDILASQGILKGFPDGLMKKDEKLTRAQAAMVLARLQGLPTDVSQVEYSYLAKEHWAEGAISSLVDAKLYSLSDFTPRNAYVTKEELVDLFGRLPAVQESTNKILNFDETGTESNYSREINTVFMRRPVKESNETDLEVFNELAGKAVVQPATTTPQDIFDYSAIANETATEKMANTAEGALPAVSVFNPTDKSIVYSNYLVVKGTVSNGHKVFINNSLVYLKNGQFYKKIKLKNGKNLIVIKAFNKNGKYTRIERRVLKLKKFADVSINDSNIKEISALATLGYISGAKGNRFNPGQKVTKVAYASMLAKVYGLRTAAPRKSPFKDLAYSHWGYKNAYALHKAGFIKAENGYYKPNDYISRAYGVVVLTRAENINVPANVSGQIYSDVNGKVWAYRHIYAAHNAGLIGSAKYFRPFEKLDRKTAAVLLAKTKKVKPKIDQLLNWNAGY